jgi:hypothetical protein
MCAAGICPGELQHSSDSDGCHEMPMDHSGSPHKHAPGQDGCSTHHHPNTNVVKADNLLQFQLTSASYTIAADVLGASIRFMAFNANACSLGGLPPPPTLGASPHQRVSILRV